ncbi:MAG: hypothetical protein IKI58_02880 [Oscillospiraceae bacterium]|nr:hypothetical protein [Oscillospiraceae bacterium]
MNSRFFGTFKKLGILCAAAGCAAAFTLTVNAAIVQQLAGYRGDLNGDFAVNLQDAELMQQYLCAESELVCEGQYADLDHSETISAVDLTLLKRGAFRGTEPEGIYTDVEIPDPQLIDPPIQAIKPKLPSVGEPRILLIEVDFPDFEHDEGFTTEQIRERTFGPEDLYNAAYPVESISAYYKRASYGHLNLQGDVYQCLVRYGLDTFVNDFDMLLDEVLLGLDGMIDYNDYDANGDGIMDTVILALPGSAEGRDVNGDGTEDWWPCSGGYTGYRRFDGVKPGNLCIGACNLNDRSGFNSTWIHELGHAMGLPDYYKYKNYSANESDGLSGNYGWEMMDDAWGDMSSFSKLMLGWYYDSDIQIYTGGNQTFTIKSYEFEPSFILIPRGDLNDFHSEYFIIEVEKPEGNNTAYFYDSKRYRMFTVTAARILHCNAELWNGYWGPELKWYNYGQMYDDSNEKQRVLRMVTENGGGYRAGSVIDYNSEGFAWYDNNGDLTVDPGITITFESLADDGTCVVTISENIEDVN